MKFGKKKFVKKKLKWEGNNIFFSAICLFFLGSYYYWFLFGLDTLNFCIENIVTTSKEYFSIFGNTPNNPEPIA